MNATRYELLSTLNYSFQKYQQGVIMKVKLIGTSPLILHNNQTADPLNDFAKKIGKLTKKQKKTEADHLEIRRLEFLAGLYLGPNGPIVPTKCIRATLINGARKDKNGKNFESGLFVLGDADILYEGPRDPKGLYESGFAWSTPCGNQRSTIIRTRPRFDKWELLFECDLDPELIDVDMFSKALQRAEKAVGLCDGRSIGMGRFTSSILK